MKFLKTAIERRRFLATTSTGIVALLGWPGDADSSPRGSVGQRQIAIVKEFLLSWSTDMPTVLSYLTEDCECRLTQWGPERKGHLRIADGLATYVGRPRAVVTRIIDCSSAGAVVMAHYENRYVYESGDLVWEGVGTFLVKGDKIKEWRGYTIRVGP